MKSEIESMLINLCELIAKENSPKQLLLLSTKLKGLSKALDEKLKKILKINEKSTKKINYSK